jgi:MtN3 and saliva related transmembrane protein
MIIDIIGFVAGFLSAVSLVPQLIKSYRTRSLNDISLSALLIIASATGMWALYGFLIRSLPLIVTDGFLFLVAVALVFLKMKH